jgi:anti-anti-sigma factor
MDSGEITRLSFEGDFDDVDLPPFEERIGKHFEDGCRFLVMDLRYLTFLTSRVVSYFVRVKEQAVQRGGDLLLVDPSPFVRKVLERLRLDEHFRIVSSETEALDEIQRGGDRDANG